jgi:P-type conjugative transfer protein TrbG
MMRPALCLFAATLWAQSDTKPIVVQIEPPRGADQAPLKMPPIEDFVKANALLTAPTQTTLPNLQPTAPESSAASGAPTNGLARAPKTYKPTIDVPLDTNAAKALRLSQEYMDRPNDPVQGRDGALLYTYGAGVPTIVCAPGHLSTIELEPGETLNDKAQLSDETRWDLLFASIGKDEGARSLIMLRPHDSGLDANLVVATNRRIYYLRLLSKVHDYMARVSFQYPGTASQSSWADYRQQQTEQEASRKEEKKQESVVRPGFYCSPDSGYRFKGPTLYWHPLSACDNGKDTTYITLPDVVRTMGSPVFMVRGPEHGDKGLQPANYDVQDTTIVIHRLFYKGALITGTGKSKRELQVISPRAN